jgi:rubrerythrin
MRTAYAAVAALSDRRDEDRVEVHCCGCGYGAVVARPPTRCPMCGRGAWRPAAGYVLRAQR